MCAGRLGWAIGLEIAYLIIYICNSYTNMSPIFGRAVREKSLRRCQSPAVSCSFSGMLHHSGMDVRILIHKVSRGVGAQTKLKKGVCVEAIFGARHCDE